MSIADLPTLNAILNSISAVLLVTGHHFIRQNQTTRHRACMIAAFITSSLFLLSYLIYHYNVGSVKFQGQGIVRPIYFAILLTHTVLAAVIVPMIFITFVWALKGRFDRHRAIARWTFPLWLYVSVTGVVVYLMLYHLYRAG
jgi:putative membrane protein